MKSAIITALLIILTGCVSTNERIRRESANGTINNITPAQSELLGALIGAGIGIGLGSAINTGIDEKWENYGSSTYSGHWNNKPTGGRKNGRRGGRKGGYSQRSGYQYISKFTTKNHKGNNMVGMALQLSQIGASYGRQIGIENQLRKLQEENELLRRQIN